jgi:hypothetical protein
MYPKQESEAFRRRFTGIKSNWYLKFKHVAKLVPKNSRQIKTCAVEANLTQ